MKNFFRILRTRIFFYVLGKLSHPETLPLYMRNYNEIDAGDVAIVNHPNGEIEVGQVERKGLNYQHGRGLGKAPTITVFLRIYRRPK